MSLDKGFGGFSEQAAPFPQSQSSRQVTAWPNAPMGTEIAISSAPFLGLRPASAGPSATSDQDLLAALLAQVVPDGSMEVANRAVARFGSFASTISQPQAELLKVPGLGPHSVAAIKLVHATALRLSRSAIMDRPAMTSLDAIIPYLTAVLTL